MSRFYLTTAIDYANGDPHLGHALEKIGADAIARYRRLRGDTVSFLMGMDEHGQKVALAAERAGLPPQAWVDRIADRFDQTWRSLSCSHTDWIRTTEPRHQAGVTAFLERIQARHPSDLFTGEYDGVYCVGCEEFKQDAQIEQGRCQEHPTLDLVPMRETNYFFRLSRFGPEILDRMRSGRFRVEPAVRRNEIVRVLEDGLQDLSVSRVRFPWGIPFPGDPGHTVYVWFDALLNYLTATGFPAPGYETRWPADLHIVGKGITRLHCALWPAMLLAADLPLPRMVWAHGYVQWGGAKVSKSAGTAVSLDAAIARHGSDALRYFLLREVGFENDGNFTFERFDERYTADLADGLGNLVSRTLVMIVKYRGGTVPAGAPDTPLDRAGDDACQRYTEAMDHYDLRGGAEAAWSLVTAANQFIVRSEPWALAKRGDEASLDTVLAALARCLYRLAVLIEPFLPQTSTTLLAYLGESSSAGAVHVSALSLPPVEGRQVERPAILFPKPDPTSPPPHRQAF